MARAQAMATPTEHLDCACTWDTGVACAGAAKFGCGGCPWNAWEAAMTVQPAPRPVSAILLLGDVIRKRARRRLTSHRRVALHVA